MAEHDNTGKWVRLDTVVRQANVEQFIEELRPHFGFHPFPIVLESFRFNINYIKDNGFRSFYRMTDDYLAHIEGLTRSGRASFEAREGTEHFPPFWLFNSTSTASRFPPTAMSAGSSSPTRNAPWKVHSRATGAGGWSWTPNVRSLPLVGLQRRSDGSGSTGLAIPATDSAGRLGLWQLGRYERHGRSSMPWLCEYGEGTPPCPRGECVCPAPARADQRDARCLHSVRSATPRSPRGWLRGRGRTFLHRAIRRSFAQCDRPEPARAGRVPRRHDGRCLQPTPSVPHDPRPGAAAETYAQHPCPAPPSGERRLAHTPARPLRPRSRMTSAIACSAGVCAREASRASRMRRLGA